MKGYNVISIRMIIILSFSLLFVNTAIFGQNEKNKRKFQKISRPEKCWAISHPFIAKKTFLLTKKVKATTDSIGKLNILDGENYEGQLDSFRHSYWMAKLTQNIKWRKAWKLGKAHERGNYLTFKKGVKKGKENLPDKVSSEMDFWNNRVGIEIGLNNKELCSIDLQKIILDSVGAGSMKIIKKNSVGDFLNENDNIIHPDSLLGKWENSKCLVPSNYIQE